MPAVPLPALAGRGKVRGRGICFNASYCRPRACLPDSAEANHLAPHPASPRKRGEESFRREPHLRRYGTELCEKRRLLGFGGLDVPQLHMAEAPDLFRE